MVAHSDYYAILGVLPTAEAIVIRAAYKALAQRYHPDRFAGSLEEANRRMAEINEAYAVLSDIDKRREYDKSRGTQTQDDGTYFDEDNDNRQPNNDPLRDDWKTAIKYYPDLVGIEYRLSRISRRLAYIYKAHLLETKQFDNRTIIASNMERQFFKLYFGENEEIIAFAYELVMSGHKAAARALNKAVSVLGKTAVPRNVINKIKIEHGLMPKQEAHHKPKHTPQEEAEDNASLAGWALLLVVVLFFMLMYIISIATA